MLQSGSHGNGHTATVRTFDWTSNGLFTGAEDSTIAVWSPNDSFREYVQFAAANVPFIPVIHVISLIVFRNNRRHSSTLTLLLLMPIKWRCNTDYVIVM